MLDTLYLIAYNWPPEYGGPGMYYQRHLSELTGIARHVMILARSHQRTVDLGDAPPNVTAVPMQAPRSRIAAYTFGPRLAVRLLHLIAGRRRTAGILFTGGSISIGWRCVALCMAAVGVPVLVENVLFHTDDGGSLRRARWPLFTALAASRLRSFCPVSSGLLASVKSAFPHAETTWLPYGVNLATNAVPTPEGRLAARQSLGVDESAFIATSFGGLHERKGQLPLIDAWLRWVEAGGHFDARLFVVGPFTDLSYVEAIRVRVQAGNPAAADTVRLMGLSYDVTMFHRAADVYLTAAYAEGLPISVVEALAHGVPAICRRLDGVTDDFMFGHAVTAVPDWNVDAVVKTLNRFMDSSYRFQAAKDARSVAEARFDIARRVDTILRLLSHPHEALANVA